MNSDPKAQSKSVTSRRILSGAGWILLFMASILAVGSFDIGLNDSIMVTLVVILAGISILMFWFGGFNGRRCASRK